MREFRILGFENYDGDSFNLTLDLGFDLVHHVSARIEGIDTPELRGGTELSKAAGRLARDTARRFVRDALNTGGAVFLSTSYRGKYGRPLGDIQRGRDGKLLSAMLFDMRLAVPYAGQAKSEVAAAHQKNIEALVESGRLQE